MNLQQFEQVLVGGGGSLKKFGRHENCVVVDSRDDAKTILKDVQRQLPDGWWNVRPIGENGFAIDKGDGTYYLDFPEGMDPELIIQSINSALLPEFEMRVFLPSVSDTISLLLQPADWWNEFESKYPIYLKRLFVTVDERVRQIKRGR